MAISIVQELKTDLILHAKIRRRPNVELFVRGVLRSTSDPTDDLEVPTVRL